MPPASTWKPSPISFPGLETVGPFLAYRDAIRLLYDAYFSGDLAYLKDRCDLTVNSPLHGCYVRTIKDEDGTEREVWFHGTYSGFGDRPADEYASQTYNREGEPVDDEGSEWLFTFHEFLGWVWLHDGLRKYVRCPIASGQPGPVPIELIPDSSIGVNRLYYGAFTGWVKWSPPGEPDVFFPQSDVDEVVKTLKPKEDMPDAEDDFSEKSKANAPEKADRAPEKAEDISEAKASDAPETKKDGTPRKRAGRGEGPLRKAIDKALDALGVEAKNDEIAIWICQNIQKYQDEFSKRTEKKNPHRLVFGCKWASFGKRVKEARDERQGKKRSKKISKKTSPGSK